MAFIINKSLSSSIVADLWKISKVTLLYKSDSKSDFSNYRPISVFPCLAKVLEQVVHRQLSNYLEKHCLLKSSQFGFHPRRSTEVACNLLVDDIHKNIDNSLLTEIIYLNLSKTFDTVSHSYLLSKLPSYGIVEMNLLGLKIISLTGSSMYSTMGIYQKHSQSSQAFHKDQFSVQHCFYSIWATLITVYAILVLSSMLTTQ